MEQHHRIHFTATAEIRFPATDIGLILLNGGNHPSAPREKMVPSTYKETVEWEDGSVSPGIAEPSPFWLIDTGATKIVIDSGLSTNNISSIDKIFKARGLSQYYVPLSEISVDKFLTARGLISDDIDIVILSHWHMDHFQNIGAFKRARIIVHQREVIAALAPQPYDQAHWRELAPYLIAVLDCVEIVHGDFKLCEGIEVWHVGGHSPGQLAVLVDTGIGRAAIASDFFNTYRNIEFDWPPGVYSNLDQWEENCRRIKRAADVIVPGHDWAVWKHFPLGSIG